MGLFARLTSLQNLFGTAIARRRWGAELDASDEDDPPVWEADHTDDDPGPEQVLTVELRALDPEDA